MARIEYVLYTMRNLFLAFCAIFLVACHAENEEELFPQKTVDTDAPISFMREVSPIIKNNCATAGCHEPRGTGNGNFETYAGIKLKVDNGTLERRAIVNKDMPAAGPLPQRQIDILKAWIDQGAPNN